MDKIIDSKQLHLKAYEMRLEVIKMLGKAGSGHAGGALGLADIYTYLYFNYLKHDAQNPGWADRDYVLVSNGHTCPIWYAVLAHSGYFPVEELGGLRQLGSILQGHPKNTETPGIFNSSGPLGHGEGQAVGVAMGLKLDSKPNRVYCFMSDGGQQEGAVWESALIANKFKLNNLTFILDLNDIQIDGFVRDIMPMPDFSKIYSELGWNVVQIDGHDFAQITNAFESTKPETGDKPNLIIAKTTPGKGVSFMENNYEWHDWKGTPEQVQQAVGELEAKINELKN